MPRKPSATMRTFAHPTAGQRAALHVLPPDSTAPAGMTHYITRQAWDVKRGEWRPLSGGVYTPGEAGALRTLRRWGFEVPTTEGHAT